MAPLRGTGGRHLRRPGRDNRALRAAQAADRDDDGGCRGALGEPTHDTATVGVSGTVPEGATLTFEAYRQDGETATCTADTLMFLSDSVPVDGPGEYRSEEGMFEKDRIYYWVEIQHDRDGELVHRGLCGAPNETTKVLPVPVIPPPPGPPTLALTGGGDGMLPFGIAGGIIALAGGLTLWFGRRLEIYRERHGYVREEDQLDGMSEPGIEHLTSN